MTLEAIPIDRVVHEWDWIRSRCSLPYLLLRLLDGRAVAFRVESTDAVVILSSAKTKDSGIDALWAEGVGGKCGFRPKKNVQTMRSVLTDIELIARRAQCAEVRIEGGKREGWKARLLPSFGFAPVELSTGLVWRKAV